MTYLALDLGAGSGRAIAGTIANGKIILDEVHRFPNRQVQLGGTLYWDFLSLFAEVKKGIAMAVQKGYTLSGIAVDTWGVDFGLLDCDGRLLANPVCYRDARTKGMLDEAFNYIDKNRFYSVTGNQFMEINSAFQLLSMVKHQNPQLSIAKKLLFTPDLLNYFLTGVACNEYTIASTSQLMNAQTRQWEPEVFQKLNLPQLLMQRIVAPGSFIGKLSSDVTIETGANTSVFAVGSHDTASAVAAIPAINSSNWAYISSGTWSLMGIESDNAIMTPEALTGDFTNEGGVGGKIRFLRNITGLWLLQCLIRDWEKEGWLCEYDELLDAAAKAAPFRCVINPDNGIFANPANMQAAINEYCYLTNQNKPQNRSEYVRTVLESLALKYCAVLHKLEQCTGKTIDCIYVVGGGSRNKLLNQFTANALGIPVITGAIESTALGNIMVQALAIGDLQSLAEGRQLIANSFDSQTYPPNDTQVWAKMYEKNKSIMD